MLPREATFRTAARIDWGEGGGGPMSRHGPAADAGRSARPPARPKARLIHPGPDESLQSSAGFRVLEGSWENGRHHHLDGDSSMKTATSALAALALLAAPCAFAHGVEAGDAAHLPGTQAAKVTLVYQHAIPGVAGKSVKGVLVEYGPGGHSPAHTHAKSALIYATVLEGEIRSKVNDGPEKVFHAGENWTELPGDHHVVSANASATKPAKILAVFIVDDADQALTTPDKP
jgi:quercetin dioxygenase-like cupin family protein